MSDTVSVEVPVEVSTRATHVAQLGRTALLLHSLSLVSAAIAVAPAFLQPRQSPDVITFMAVIGSAAFALNIWSVALALGALRSAESFRIPCAVVAAFLLESSAISLMGWGQAPNWNYQIWLVSLALAAGAPFFVPFFSTLILLLAPISAWIAKRRSRPQEAAVEFRKRCTRALFLLLAGATVLFMPLPLFYYCAVFCGEYWNESQCWQATVASNMPNVIREIVCDRVTEKSPLHFKLLSEGWMSIPRLERYSREKNQLGALAVRGLMKADRQIALRFATQVADGKIFSSGSISNVAAEVICDEKSADEVRKYLASAADANMFRNALISHIGNNGKTEFIPDLDRIMSEENAPRTALLIALARLLPPAEIVKRWPEYLAHPDPTSRLEAAEAMYSFPSQKIWNDTAQAALAGDNPLVHRAVLNRLCVTFRDGEVQAEDRRRWVEMLLALLDAPDLPRRRGAIRWLTVEMNMPITRLGTPTGLEDDAPADEPSQPETEDERRDIEQLKARAQAWLRKHG